MSCPPTTGRRSSSLVGSPAGWRGERCLHRIFERQAARTPNAVALAFRTLGAAGSAAFPQREELSYAELDAAADRLARALRAQGVGPERVVALAAERGPELILGVLGVLKAGAAYLPLDPEHPESRIAYQLEDAGVELLLTTREVARRLAAGDRRRQIIERLLLDADALPPAPEAELDAQSLAYVIYTSGSTGRPKGVLVSHAGLEQLVEAQRELFAAAPGKRVLQWAPPSFDASVFELAMAFGSGATLVLADRETLKPGPQLLELLEREQITHWTVPPSVLSALGGAAASERLTRLENLVCAGEALPASLAAAWGAGRRLWNAYGPTEATIWSAVERCRPGRTPTLGGAVAGATLEVVDARLEPLPAGEAGELLIGGGGLARGYLGRPALTAACFVPDPWSAEPGARRYRSGDAVRRLPGGELDFVGRIDHQIKIRGQRIEPGEIEAVLERHPEVARSVVVARRDGGGEARLVAYVVPAVAGERPAPREWAEEELPDGWVPAAFVALDELPLTAHGKIDRDALPAPAVADFGAAPAAAGGERQASDPIEQALLALCRELWGLPDLGLDDDLIELGGHSLLVGRLAARMRSAFRVEIGLGQIFAQPSVAALAELVRGGGAGRALPPVVRAPRDRPGPLSFPQERVWFLDQLAPGNVAYNSQATLTFSGPLDPRVYERVLTEIVRRHEVFRTRFPALDGRPVQIVEPPMPVRLPLVDLSALAADQRPTVSERLVARAVEEPFDLESPPLARWTLIRRSPLDHVLIQVEHHFVHDGWAFGVLMGEMKALYTAFAAGEPSPLPEPPMHSVDFARWQREWMRGEVLEEYLAHFTRMLAGSSERLDLPTDRPRPPMQSFRGDLVRLDLPAELAAGLRRLVRSTSSTLFVVMLAGFAALLWRLSGQRDLLIGSAAANRRLREMEKMLGMVVNTLVLRAQPAPHKPFSALMSELRDMAIGAFAYQDMPLDKLVERLDPERDLSRNPLFQVMFSFHDSPVPELDFAGLHGTILERHNGSAKSDLNIVVIPRAEQRVGQGPRDDRQPITLLWEYCVDLFDRPTIERMVGHYLELLTSAVAHPDAPLAELSLLPGRERRAIERFAAGPALELPAAALHELVERAAAARPAATALAGKDAAGRRVEWSYGELERRANQLAHRLLAVLGDGEPIVALILPRGPELALAALAALKAGAAYLPLDPEHPSERTVYALRDAAVAAVVTAGEPAPEVLAALAETDAEHVDLDAEWSELARRPSARPALPAHPERCAYVIYTSGSTGRPKGTQLAHRGAANLVAWHVDAFALGHEDRTTLVASPAFDASVWELWPALAAGASLHAPPEGVRRSAPDLYRWLADEAISVCFLPTPLAEAMLDGPPPRGLALRTLLVGGDRLQRAPEPGLPFRLVNNYGPTEDSVVTTSGEVAPGDGERPPTIGRPLPNKRVEVLDRRLAPLPIGVPGELCIAGAGLARGYLRRPALTAEHFVPDPRGDGTRLYRSGDRVRWTAAGEIDFLGRLDHQVKVRGYRIELGEIEHQLAEHPAVEEAVVLVLDRDLEAGLGAFVVASRPLETGELEDFLAERLPEYMLPHGYHALDELPISPTGKIDRRRLAELARELSWGAGDSGGGAPRGETEALMASLWEALLGRRGIGRRASFFALGGHSLLATRLIARVNRAFGVELPVRALFEAPTVEELAGRVEEVAAAGPRLPPVGRAERGATSPMSFAQERLWFLDRLIPEPAAYHIVRAWSLDGPLDVPRLERALGAVVARHEALRTGFEQGAEGPQQRLWDELRPPLPAIDLSALGGAREAHAAALRERAGRRPFALDRPPLLRVLLLRLAAGEHQLVWAQHHIATDGLSTAVVLGELSRLYSGERAELAPPAIGYADFALWQRRTLDDRALERLLGFWRRELAGAPAALELPLDHPRPALQSFRGELVGTRLDAETVDALEGLARTAGATWFMTVLGLYASYLSRLSGQREVVVGTPVAGRERPELESVVGLFVNTVALRVSLAGAPRLDELLARVRRTTLDALAHQALPVERLVAELAAERDLSHAPLFQTLLVLEDEEMDRLELDALEVAPLAVRRRESQFDLALFVRRDAHGAQIALRYDSALFERTTVLRMVRQLAHAMRAAARGAEQRVETLPLLAPAERHALLVEWNDSARAFPRERTVHGLFAERARAQPQAPAVVTAGEELSYGELDARSNRLAHRLRALGAGPGELVGVRLARTPALVVSLLAVLKTGAAYVPLELAWPAERCRWILEHKKVRTLITEAGRDAELDAPGPLAGLEHVIALGDAAPERAGAIVEAEIARRPSTAPPPAAGPEDLAYVIFTSGSTGQPKGVVERHRAVVNVLDWVNRSFGFGPSDRVLFTTSPTFDLSVFDVFGLLAAGGSIRLASERELEDPARLVDILLGEPVTFWDSAPAALVRLVPMLPAGEVSAALRLVFLSGDWIPVTLPPRLGRTFPAARVVSLGGATEATIWSNVFEVGAVDPEWTSIPYGRPIGNARYHVVDANLEPCPIGVVGDLLIGGEVLAAGYAAEPALTAAQFGPDPFADEAGARVYHTGDRARYWADGVLEFCGRRDRQVKVRGYRIELAEIESVLADAELPAGASLGEVVVIVREDAPGDQRLVAYFTAEGGAENELAEALKAAARARLPEYMVPATLLRLDAWPLTATGKLDRDRLPSPEGLRARAAGAAPRGVVEDVVARVWCEVIGVPEVSREDNFFDLGGHSLLVARVHGRLEQELGRRIPMADLFRYPTVASLATALAPETVVEPAPAALPATADAAAVGEETRIAIVGVAGRFAAAADVEQLWEALIEGRELLREFSRDELLAAGVSERDLDDERYVRRRGALDGAERFDAAFFDIPPREAELIDPQQRLFLETAWSALEDAGYAALADGERVGVYAGVSANDHLHRLLADEATVRAVGETAIHLGNQGDYLPTRVSYKLDLHGPSLNVQTACSTSLVAVHLASRALLAGECELALAGGVSVRGVERRGYRYEPGGIASPDGRCRAFDAGAAGTVGGSGVGVVVLKRLDRALADGDTVRAVVLGSAINNDGARKVSFTAPSVDAQARAIRDAQRAAGVEPSSISYVEAHGTGTPMGDPIEVAALAEAFGGEGAESGHCGLGSVKSNLGHLDAAAGVAGLIKTTLALERGEIPPTLHVERPNPELRLEATPFRLVTERTAWRSNGTPRRAGVSSFGIGGTNAHVVLEEAPPAEPSSPGRPAQLLVLSAKTAGALERASTDLASFLDARRDSLELADVAYTLQVGRRALPHRRAVVCRDLGEAVAALAGEAPRRVASRAERPRQPRVAFLLPGQGAQYAGMAAGLYAEEPSFRADLDHAAEVLAGVVDVGLLELLGVGEALPSSPEAIAAADRRLADTRYAQPALLAVEVALARLWRRLGVEPEALLGHSLGEYAAACLAGVFSFEDALRLVALRGELMSRMQPGAMLAAALSEAELAPLLERFGLELAAVNGERATVACGEREAIETLASELEGRGVEHRILATSHAFHGRSMQPMVEDFAFEVMAVERRPPSIRFVSNVTGTWITDEQAVDPFYWADQLRRPVRFADGLGELLAEDRVLLEVGPGRQLTTHARRAAGEASAIEISLPHPERRGDDLETMTRALGALWLAGVEVDWRAYAEGQRRRRVPLPTYPFERREFRPGASAAADGAADATESASAGGEPSAESPAPAASTSGWSSGERAVADAWRELLGVEARRHDDFFDLGGSSLMALRLAAALEERLGVALPASAVLESPTLEDLAARLDRALGGEPEAAPSCLVPLSASGGGSPLFLVHQVGGQAFTFRPLARALGGAQPVYAFRSLGLEPGETPLETIEAMAEHYLGLLREAAPRGPYRLGGASMGGMVAFEMAQRLAAAGETVDRLVLFDTPCGEQMPEREGETEALAAIFAARGVRLDVDELRALAGFEARFERALAVAAEQTGAAPTDADSLRRAAVVLLANAEALYAYRPRPYDGRLTLLRAAERRPGDPPRPELAWIELACGGLDFALAPGNHLSMHEPPHVEEVAALLRRRLEGAG